MAMIFDDLISIYKLKIKGVLNIGSNYGQEYTKYVDHLNKYQSINLNEEDFIRINELDIDKSKFNLININIQGYELDVFGNSIQFLSNVDYIITEIDNKNIYKNKEEFELFLLKYGFYRVNTSWCDVFLYIKRRIINNKTYSQAGQDQFVLSLFDNDYKGTFVDIGCNLPNIINNTLLLEENGWLGISIDNNEYFKNIWNRKTPFILEDALYCNYKEILDKNNLSNIIDYLSLDIDGNGDKFYALKRIIESGYEFKVITIEHDAYRGFDMTEREPQRNLLLNNGYVLLCADVSLCCNNAYEDWWINPKYFYEEEYNFYKSSNLQYSKILNIITTKKNLIHIDDVKSEIENTSLNNKLSEIENKIPEIVVDKSTIKISVLTLTYQRYEILEEAIQSFLYQDFDGDCEMVIINDSPLVKYVCYHKNIRVINCDTRFPTISSKIEYGYKQCRYDYIYRLDDDDLLTPWALSLTRQYILENPNYEIYRSQKQYFFTNNEYIQYSDNINNGNVFTKAYLDRIVFPDRSGDEDVDIVFGNNSKIITSDKGKYTMIYRWGMSTYHISGMGHQENDEILNWTDRIVSEKPLENGIIDLNPKFKNDYYSQLPKLEINKIETSNKKIKFIIPLPDVSYYLWQVLVQINNFRKLGYEVDAHYPVCVFNNKQTDILTELIKSDNIKSKFHPYKDTRTDTVYTASIKPWLMSQYFKEFPEEKENIYIYLDPDVIFLKPIDWSPFINDDIWYESDTCSYLDSTYIKSKNPQLFIEMCDIVGLSPELVMQNDKNCGGAQYITKNNTFEYWDEVQRLSHPLYTHMRDTAEKYKTPEQVYPIQAWTSEMWTTNWVLWKNGGKTKCIPELDFHWANHNMRDLKHSIYHNAGITEDDGQHFSKIAYQKSPFKKEIKGSQESLSYKYIEEIRDTENNFPELLDIFDK